MRPIRCLADFTEFVQGIACFRPAQTWTVYPVLLNGFLASGRWRGLPLPPPGGPRRWAPAPVPVPAPCPCPAPAPARWPPPLPHARPWGGVRGLIIALVPEGNVSSIVMLACFASNFWRQFCSQSYVCAHVEVVQIWNVSSKHPGIKLLTVNCSYLAQPELHFMNCDAHTCSGQNLSGINKSYNSSKI